jgi:hypothetical protein
LWLWRGRTFEAFGRAALGIDGSAKSGIGIGQSVDQNLRESLASSQDRLQKLNDLVGAIGSVQCLDDPRSPFRADAFRSIQVQRAGATQRR